jgi:hypothetical protein
MEKIPDYRIKPLQKLFRPYFSPYTDSYEIDYVYGGSVKVYDIETGSEILEPQNYFFCININSKYLFVKALQMGEKRRLTFTFSAMQEIKNEIEKMNSEQTIKHIRGDADSAFGKIIRFDDTKNKNFTINLGSESYRPNIFTTYLKQHDIKLYLNPSKYTNKNRVVDRVIRTISDKIGENTELFYKEIIQKAVEEYNNTRHSAFNNEYTPKEVQMHKDLEEYYIRENLKRLEEVKHQQNIEGLFFYKPGDILLIHLDNSKNIDKLNKKRRVFNRLATFLDYNHGNVVCQVLYNNVQLHPKRLYEKLIYNFNILYKIFSKIF